MDSQPPELQATGFLAIKSIITFAEVAHLLVPIKSKQEKMEVIRRAVDRNPPSKYIQLSADRN